MASLLSRFFPGTTKSDVAQDAVSNQTSEHAASTVKSTRRHSANVKARKSITSLFAITIDIMRPEIRPATPVEITATCQEAQHYPIYDSTNPEHEPSATSTETAQHHTSSQRRSPRSPKKLPHWKRSPSPKRPVTSTRAKSRLQGLADTLRAKANIFYEAPTESSVEEPLPHEAGAPSTPKSAKSISSKKSVRFRSGHSVIGNVLQHTSPITIPTQSPPSLSMVDIPNAPMFDTFSDEEKDLGKTARPPDSLLSHIPAGPSPRRTSRPQLSLDMEDATCRVQALQTPMPGTNMPLEDPFDDAAAALHPEPSASNISTSHTGPEECYLSDGENNVETHKTRTVSVRQEGSCSAVSRPLYAATSNSPKSEVSGLISDLHEGPRDTTSCAPQRTLRHTKVLPYSSTPQPSFSRSSSETQYDADGEPSEESEQQKETTNRVATRTQHASESHDKDADQESQFGVDLVRCRTPNIECSAPESTLPRFTVTKCSSDETDEVPISVFSVSEAVMQSAEHPKEDSMDFQPFSASDVLNNQDRLGPSSSGNLGPTLRAAAATCEGIEHVEPGCLIEPVKHETTASRPIINEHSARICSISSANSSLPPHLSPTVSSISPARSPWHLSGYRGTDEDVDTEISEHCSTFAREVAEESIQSSLTSCAQTAPSDISSLVGHALPIKTESGSKSMPFVQDAHGFANGNTWSPFDEQDFASAAYSALESSPLKVARHLRSEGISRDFWKQLSLPDATAPPKQQDAYSEIDLLKLFAAIADRAQAPTPADPGCFPRGSPLDYSNGPIIDIQALSTFNGPVSPLLLADQSRGRHTSQNEAGVPENASSSPESICYSDGSSLSRAFLLTDFCHSSTQDLAMNESLSPDSTHHSMLQPIPLPAEPPSYSSSGSEMRLPIAHPLNVLDSQNMTDMENEIPVEADDCPERTNSQSSQAYVEPADAYAHSQNTCLQERSFSARKQSSEESRESTRTTSSIVDSSTSSGSIFNWSHSMNSERSLHLGHKEPRGTLDVDVEVLHSEQGNVPRAYHENPHDVADTPKGVRANTDERYSAGDGGRSSFGARVIEAADTSPTPTPKCRG